MTFIMHILRTASEARQSLRAATGVHTAAGERSSVCTAGGGERCHSLLPPRNTRSQKSLSEALIKALTILVLLRCWIGAVALTTSEDKATGSERASARTTGGWWHQTAGT